MQGTRNMAFQYQTDAEKKVVAELQYELRLLSKPAWFGKYLLDMIATHSLKLCKPLPRPELIIMTPDEVEASRGQHLTPTAKRQRIAEGAERQYHPKEMHDELW